MKIVVLAGGLSPERNVSLVSGTDICRALRGRGHQAILVDLFMGVEEMPDSPEALFEAADGRCRDVEISTHAPDLEQVRASRPDQGPSRIGPHVLEICAAADAVFIGLHGQDGEDGRIQAVLDLMGVPYTGSGHLASAMAMDKEAAKRMMDALGIPTPAWRMIRYEPEDVERLAEELPMPCVVKSINGGSSLGVYLPEDRRELKDALLDVLKFHTRVLVEERIHGRELTQAVLGERYLPAVEVIPAAGKFDYEAKYQAGAAEEICPAPITEEEQRLVGETALKLHRGLGLDVYSRADFILDEAGVAWCLEINSLPGMTPTSFLPKEAAAVGMDYAALCEEILNQSLQAKQNPGV